MGGRERESERETEKEKERERDNEWQITHTHAHHSTTYQTGTRNHHDWRQPSQRACDDVVATATEEDGAMIESKTIDRWENRHETNQSTRHVGHVRFYTDKAAAE